MKNKLKTVLGASLIVPVFALSNVMVLAHETGTPHEEDGTETYQTTAQAADNEAGGSSAEDVKRRVAERKEALKIRLTAAKQARIKSRCKASQSKISSVQGRITGVETSRTQVHQNLVNRLTRLSEQLATHSVDTATLNSQITELNVLIQTFATDLTAYKTAVADLAAMDCEADPEGFQASLESARTLRAKASESAEAVRTYLTETIKPTLKELRARFAQNGSDNAGESSSAEDSTAPVSGDQGEEN